MSQERPTTRLYIRTGLYFIHPGDILLELIGLLAVGGAAWWLWGDPEGGKWIVGTFFLGGFLHISASRKSLLTSGIALLASAVFFFNGSDLTTWLTLLLAACCGALVFFTWDRA